MAKRMMADVLWEAANKRLRPDSYWNTFQSAATCCAAFWAERGCEWHGEYTCWERAANASKSVQFLRSLGCEVASDDQFDRFGHGEERQGVRYMWLLLAMHVAEDEGLTV